MKKIILILILIILVAGQTYSQKNKFYYLLTAESDPYGEELVTNGTFDLNILGWSNYPGLAFETFEWSAGKLHIINTGGRSLAGGASFAVESGKTYRVTVSLIVNSGTISGGIYLNKHAFQISRLAISPNLIESQEIDIEFNCAVTENIHVTFDVYGDCELTVDNISIKEIF